MDMMIWIAAVSAAAFFNPSVWLLTLIVVAVLVQGRWPWTLALAATVVFVVGHSLLVYDQQTRVGYPWRPEKSISVAVIHHSLALLLGFLVSTIIPKRKLA